MRRTALQFVLLIAVAGAAALAPCVPARSAENKPSFAGSIGKVQPKIVKIYGAGGANGLEPYQSGFLISAEGHVLTVWSYVLDTDYVTCVLNDGRKFEAKLLGADPRLELAVLKIEAADLDHFKLAEAAAAEAGTRVLAFSNLFGVAAGEEPASVLHGSVAARAQLEARRGVFETAYRGPVYVLDAMTNNPGAAGGALTDQQGRLLAMLGKELRNSLNNTWLNYAIPCDELAPAVSDILAGKFRTRSDAPEKKPEQALDAERLGIVLVPDVLERTPPFIDQVRAGSPAAGVGLRSDDLIVLVGDHLVQSCKALVEELSLVDRESSVRVVVMRDQALVEVVLKPGPAAPPESK